MRATGPGIAAKIGANLCDANALRGMPTCAGAATSRQATDQEGVALHRPDGNPPSAHPYSGVGRAKPCAGNHMQAAAGRVASLLSVNLLAANSLRGFGALSGREKATEIRKNLARIATLGRWCKFNFVGAIGIFVQFGVLFLLKSVLHLHYLAATAVAVEAAVAHNFLWHERYTWVDRVRLSWKKSLPRFLRFNLTTGLVSIAGNLGVMRAMVGRAHMNYLLANAIAIAVCSLVNFVVSERWVFRENG